MVNSRCSDGSVDLPKDRELEEFVLGALYFMLNINFDTLVINSEDLDDTNVTKGDTPMCTPRVGVGEGSLLQNSSTADTLVSELAKLEEEQKRKRTARKVQFQNTVERVTFVTRTYTYEVPVVEEVPHFAPVFPTVHRDSFPRRLLRSMGSFVRCFSVRDSDDDDQGDQVVVMRSRSVLLRTVEREFEPLDGSSKPLTDLPSYYKWDLPGMLGDVEEED